MASKQWYTKAVEWCYAKGVVTGDKDASGKITGYFRPNDPVSREELGVMLYRFASLYGYVTTSSYELYVVGQEDLTPYTHTRTVLFVKTDAAISDQLKLVDKTESNVKNTLTVESVDVFSDITFTDSEATAGVWRAVKGGWVLFCYFNVAGTHTLQLCNGNRVLANFTVQVADYDAAEDAWIDAVIAKCTTSSMDSFAKMTAVENWLRAHFKATLNKSAA